MNHKAALTLLALSLALPACNQQSPPDNLPVETHTPPQSGDLDLGGMKFDANRKITHLRDEETGEWLPLTPEESELLTERYRDLVEKVGPPKGYNPK